jgi:hypothetical protein
VELEFHLLRLVLARRVYGETLNDPVRWEVIEATRERLYRAMELAALGSLVEDGELTREEAKEVLEAKLKASDSPMYVYREVLSKDGYLAVIAKLRAIQEPLNPAPESWKEIPKTMPPVPASAF